MPEMNRFERWMINRRTERRARGTLHRVGPVLTVAPTARILELGSGGGGLLALLHERYHPARLVGTDYDPAEVAFAREFLTRRWGSVPASIELRRADAQAIPFPEASFDFVFAMLVLHHVEERFSDYVHRPRALGEIRRVLSPGGFLVYSELFRRKDIRNTLAELGFTRVFLRAGLRHDLGVFRSPGFREPGGPEAVRAERGAA